MINSHKEFIGEVKNFSEKMELINDFHYIKDVELLNTEVQKRKPKVLVLGLSDAVFDDENYNMNLTYKFMLADSVQYNDNAIIDSETDNLFIVSSLKDYLTYVQETTVEIDGLEFSVESDGQTTYSSVTGSFDFIVKRSPSYWKKMEDYNAEQ